MSPPPVRSRPHGLTFVILLALAGLTATLFFLAPHAQRWRVVTALTARTPAQREPALTFLEHRAASDATLVASAVAALPRADDANFMQIARVLDRAGVWSAHRVPTPTWGRWLRLLAGEGDEASQLFAATHLGELRALADVATTAPTLGRLIWEGTSRVRYHALIACASLAGVATEPAPYIDLLRLGARDSVPRIARDAWISLALLGVQPPPELDWNAAPPEVAEAMVWAAAYSNRDNPERVALLLADPEAPPHLRAAAAYALHLSPSELATTSLLDAADVPVETIGPTNYLVVWRAVLSLPKPNLAQRDLTRLEEVVAAPAWDEGSDPLIEPIALASVYRMGIAGARRQVEDYFGYDDLRKLATVEGQEPPYMHWPITGQKPPILRVMTVAVSRDPRLSDMLFAFASPKATMRDLACVVAIERFEAAALEPVVQTLLASASADTRKSGAVLAGLSGLHRDMLNTMADADPDQATRAVARLAKLADPAVALETPAATAAFGNAAAPPTSSVLVLFARGNLVAGLDRLFNPHGEARLNLVQTLGHDRWWHVLRHYLPKSPDTPPFWVWGDRDVQAFQVDVLRNWYLVNRHRLIEGPPPATPSEQPVAANGAPAASAASAPPIVVGTSGDTDGE